MSIPKNLDFNDYDQYPADENPTTDAQMQEFMRNQNVLMQQLASMVWQPNTAYEAGHVIRSSAMPSGLQAIVTTAGVTGNDEPQWDGVGRYVQDGGVIYIMRSITVVDLIYPVGIIVHLAVSTNPNVLFGIGVWERLGQGRVVLDSGSNYPALTEGGSATHVLTVGEMPSHNHSGSTGGAGAHTPSGTVVSASITGSANVNDTAVETQAWSDSPSSGWSFSGMVSASGWRTCRTMSNTSTSASQLKGLNFNASHGHTFNGNAVSNHTHSITINNNGSGEAFSVMQPYFAGYIWKRVS